MMIERVRKTVIRANALMYFNLIIHIVGIFITTYIFTMLWKIIFRLWY